MESEQGCLKDGREKKNHILPRSREIIPDLGSKPLWIKTLWNKRTITLFFFLLIHKAICLFNGIRIKSSWNGFLIKIMLCLSEWEHLTDYKGNVANSGIPFPISQARPCLKLPVLNPVLTLCRLLHLSSPHPIYQKKSCRTHRVSVKAEIKDLSLNLLEFSLLNSGNFLS